MEVLERREELDALYSQFISEFDQGHAEQVWDRQSADFRNFWDAELLKTGSPSQEGLDRVIQYLDSHAKGIADSDAEQACNPLITQRSWYRIFEEFRKNKKLYKLVTTIFRCDSDDKQV